MKNTPLGNGPNGDGNHNASGDMGFGISVYGYGQDTTSSASRVE